MGNPYDAAQREWDERFAFHARNAKRWFIACISSFAFATIGIGFGIWASVKSEYVPYIVMVDDLGRAEKAPSPRTTSEWPDAVIKREVSDFVNLARSIPGDSVVLENNLRRMFYFLQSGDPADQKIRESGRNPETAPLVLAERITKEVDVATVNFIGGTSWLVEWRETTRQKSSGNVVQVARFKGTYILKRASKISPEIMNDNPLGVIIKDYDIQNLGGS
jgi:type IV secretory pathway TrbF-like protein